MISRGFCAARHETYRGAAGQYEAVYSGMPPFGLSAFGKVSTVGGKRDNARGRIGASESAPQLAGSQASALDQHLELRPGDFAVTNPVAEAAVGASNHVLAANHLRVPD